MAGSDLIIMIGLNVIWKFILSSGLGADGKGYCGPCGYDVGRLQSSDNEHYVGGAISGGSMPKLGWWTRLGIYRHQAASGFCVRVRDTQAFRRPSYVQ
jgi:hypothetical protein